MTGRAIGQGAHEHDIAIAIRRDCGDIEVIATRRALFPEFVAAAAPENDMRSRERARESLCVHVADHQHVFRFRMLHDCRNEARRVPPKVVRRY